MSGNDTYVHASCTELVNRCESLTERIGHVSTPRLLDELRELVDDLPESLDPAERTALGTAVAGVLSACVGQDKTDVWRDLASVLLELVAASGTSRAFRRECLELIDRCVDGACCCDGVMCRCGDLPQERDSLSRVLRAIHANYGRARLSLRDISRETELSVWHVSRLLKRHSGCGFTAYVNELRVSAAQRLLQTTTLSIKQVAASVGYTNTSQLDRHFRRVCHTTPVSFRRSCGPTRVLIDDECQHEATEGKF